LHKIYKYRGMFGLLTWRLHGWV